MADEMPRDKVIALLRTYAGGADFTEPLLREVCRQAFRLLHRERGAENVHHPDPTIGTLTPTDPAKVIAKAAEKLLVPAGSVMHDGFIELPPGSSPLDAVRVSVPPTDDSAAYGYLRRVFEHCAPQCTPLPDMLGLCTQIDNLIAGYRIDLGLMPDPAKPSSLPRR